MIRKITSILIAMSLMFTGISAFDDTHCNSRPLDAADTGSRGELRGF